MTRRPAGLATYVLKRVTIDFRAPSAWTDEQAEKWLDEVGDEVEDAIGDGLSRLLAKYPEVIVEVD